MKKRIILEILILFLIIPISEKVDINPTIYNIVNEEKPIATLLIKKINLKQPIYKINSPNNTIEKHVTILKESILPNENNSIIFLAAHSGTGKIAYFEQLNHLDINDELVLIYQNKKHYYNVIDIWEEEKNGYINVNKAKEKQLVLTTCSPTNKNNQLIINSIEKESFS